MYNSTLPFQPTAAAITATSRYRIERAKMILAEQLKTQVKDVIERKKLVTLAKYVIDPHPVLLQHTLKTYSTDVISLQNTINHLSRILKNTEIELYCTIIPMRIPGGVRNMALLTISSAQQKKMISISSDPGLGIRVYSLPCRANGFLSHLEDPTAGLRSIAQQMVDFFNQQAPSAS